MNSTYPATDGDVRPPRPASPPWVGLVVSVLVLGGSAWLIVSTSFDLPFFTRLGVWNYVGTVALIAVGWGVLRSAWHSSRP